MTEQDWLICDDPRRMLEYLRLSALDANWVNHPGSKWMDRKLRLFACACCRHSPHPLADVRGKRAIEMAELHADGKCSDDDWLRAGAHAGMVPRIPPRSDHLVMAATALGQLSRGSDLLSWLSPEICPLPAQSALLRDIFGNPFRPILVTDNEWRIEHEQLRPGIYEPRKTVFRTKWLAWNDGAVRKLAEAIYDERAFECLPILADALEEAGCDNQEMLMHCRNKRKKITKHYECPICGTECELKTHWNWGALKESYSCPNRSDLFLPHSWVTPQEGKELWLESSELHVRGCWVIDLLLGK